MFKVRFKGSVCSQVAKDKGLDIWEWGEELVKITVCIPERMPPSPESLVDHNVLWRWRMAAPVRYELGAHPGHRAEGLWARC